MKTNVWWCFQGMKAELRTFSEGPDGGQFNLMGCWVSASITQLFQDRAKPTTDLMQITEFQYNLIYSNLHLAGFGL